MTASSFPNSYEQSVASDLLLLAFSPRSNATLTRCKNDRNDDVSSDEGPLRTVTCAIYHLRLLSNGTLTRCKNDRNDDVSSDEGPLRTVTCAIYRLRQLNLNLKVIRKRRSKTLRKSNSGKISKAVASASRSILNLLAVGPAREAKIRKWLGDNPDTSKALRMLWQKHKVRRSGAGGKKNPFMYERAAK